MMAAVIHGASLLFHLLADLAAFIWLLFRPRRAVAAKNLFQRRQLAMCQERGAKARRTDEATRASLVLLSNFFDWRGALVNVTPRTFLRCQSSRVLPVLALEIAARATTDTHRTQATDP